MTNGDDQEKMKMKKNKKNRSFKHLYTFVATSFI